MNRRWLLLGCLGLAVGLAACGRGAIRVDKDDDSSDDDITMTSQMSNSDRFEGRRGEGLWGSLETIRHCHAEQRRGYVNV